MNFIQIVRSFDVPVNSAASLGSISRHSGTHRAQRVRERGEKERGGAKRDLRRDERSDGGEGADDDTERTPERRVTSLERETGH